MKHMKKLASLLLALVMVFAMGTTAFADAGTGTITVANPKADQAYTAYKIFDVTYNAAEAYSYTISSDSEWFGVVTSMNDAGEVSSSITGLSFEKAFSDDSTYVVIQDASFSAADFANTLKNSINGKNGTDLTVSDSQATASGLDLGYYFVTSASGALCNLTTTNPSVTIYDKNDVPFDKVDDKDSVEVGEVVNYTITGKVPDTTGFTTYKYQITDTMSDGLTFNSDVKVYINDEELTNATKYTIKTGTDDGKDFVLDIDVMGLTAGAKIEVKYSATVNENASAKVSNNHATLEYSSDPTDKSKTTTREDTETVYSAKIVINKYAEQENENESSEQENATDTSQKKLADAKFVLYKEVTEGDADESTRRYYKYTAATQDNLAKVEWVENKADATEVTTDDNGAAEFAGLKDGTYYLEETAAPAGYNLLKEPVEITIEGQTDTAGKIIESSLTCTADVLNQSGAELPSTGGTGTTIFYVVGGILVVGAAVLLITKKRMSAEK